MEKIVDHDAARSAISHIEIVESRLKLLKQCINTKEGVICDKQMVCRLVLGAEDGINKLRADMVKFI